MQAIAAASMLGLSAERICAENGDLDPSLIHAALAYYFANRAAIEADLAADRDEEERLAAEYPAGITAETFRENDGPAGVSPQPLMTMTLAASAG